MTEQKEHKTITIYLESGVIPFRKNGDTLEILLITNKKKSKWGIPKGMIERECTASDSAQIEAYEEAGIKGRIFKPAVGRYIKKKWDGQCNVKVYPLEVTEVMDKYPEDMLRKRAWFSVSDAAAQIKNKKLRDLILRFPDMLVKKYGF
ncbi:MAG: NUDIX hydrolase [Spirochaetia bacterium]|nr:NUDIX hydrolase [Spirochaetia bacterium]